jgi:hypothetical protein
LDAGAEACGDAFCASGEACVRGVCVATCGEDASGWSDALGEGLRPVASFCRAAAARAARVEGETLEVWDLTTTSEATSTTFVLSRWAASSAMPAVTEVARGVHDTGSADVLVFPGSYLALAPSGGAAAFGYTTTAEGFAGGVFRVQRSDGASAELDAPGNFGAAWLDDDTLLVNGLGLDGEGGEQGLYAAVFAPSGVRIVHVASGLGVASGSVAVTSSMVLVGGYFEGFESRAYALARARVEAVLAGTEPTMDVAAGADTAPGIDLVGGFASTFDRAGTLLVVAEYDDAFMLTGLAGHEIVSYSAEGGLELAAPLALTRGGTFTSAHEAGAGQLLLAFGSGLLLVER